MKILKRTVPEVTAVYRGICGLCDTVVEATGEEISLVWNYDADRQLILSPLRIGEAPCPVCKRRMDFYGKELEGYRMASEKAGIYE